MAMWMKGPEANARISIGSTPDEHGHVEIPETMLEQALAHGFVPVTPAPKAEAVPAPAIRRPSVRRKDR